jgi:hypothetical protein
VDRVQYEGQRTSQYVIGQRRASDETISSYYDPQPAWKDFEGGTYAPRACALFRVGKGLTMPTGSRRLTVREFEQAVIAGAECFDDADEALAGSIESDFNSEGAGYFEEDDSDTMATERLYDGRVSLMETGLGSQGRPSSSFTDQEEYLAGILRMVGAEREVEMLHLASQEPNMIHRSMMSSGGYDGVVSLLQFIQKDAADDDNAAYNAQLNQECDSLIANSNNPAEIERINAWRKKMLMQSTIEFVTAALCGDQDAEDTSEPTEALSYSAAVALFDDWDRKAYSIPTGRNGACRRASFMSWK